MNKIRDNIRRLVLTAAIILWFSGTITGNAETDLESSIKEKQAAISQAQKEKTSLQSGMTDARKVVDGLEKTKKDLAAYVEELDVSLNTATEKIAGLKTMIEEKEAEIKEASEDLKEATERERTQYEAMKVRIQFMYEKGDVLYLDILFSADGFADMLNKADYIEALSAYDRRKLEEYRQNRHLIELCRQELEAEQELLDEARDKVEQEQDSLQVMIGAKEQQITAYESDITNREQLIREYEAEIAAQDSAIAELEAAVAAEKKRLEAQNTVQITYNGGMFQFPAPSCTRISSEYGTRMHPTLGVEKFHNGVDMAAPSGSPILAAYDGNVVASAYSGSMGNYIMIDHGSGLYTIYMHASALYVSSGTSVAKGEKIAAVGSTGRSTGPHLHFGVRLNGSYVNPQNYLGS